MVTVKFNLNVSGVARLLWIEIFINPTAPHDILSGVARLLWIEIDHLVETGGQDVSGVARLLWIEMIDERGKAHGGKVRSRKTPVD